MDKIQIENFRGDAVGLEAMAHTAWRQEYGRDSYPNLYHPSYLAYLLQNVTDPRLILAAYRGEEIVGFLLNLPRRMAFRGKIYRAALSCLLVVRKEFFRQGMAQALIQEGLKRNKELQFDFTLFYLETGHNSSRLFAKLRAAGAPIMRVKRMHVIGRVLDLPALTASENIKWYEKAVLRFLAAHRAPRQEPAGEVREAGREDSGALLSLFNTYAQKVPLARVFEEEEMSRELIHPPVARTLVYEKGGRIAGALSYVMVEHVGRRRLPWAWLNHVAWENLSWIERRRLVRAFLREVHSRGCTGVVEWSKGYYSAGPLYAERFVPYPRQVDMMAWTFRPGFALSRLPSVYEVQI